MGGTVGNLDFTNNAGFSWYCILLLVSGIALVVMGPVPGLNKGTRVLNLVFGLGFLGYGIYLTFFFDGGSYFIFFKAFIAPVVLIVNTIREVRAAQLSRRTPAPQPFPGQAQPYFQAQPQPYYQAQPQPFPGQPQQYDQTQPQQPFAAQPQPQAQTPVPPQ